jgi:hypothetical protein
VIVVSRSPPAHQQERHQDPDDDREQNALGMSSQGEREYQHRDANQEAWPPAGRLVNDPGLPHTTHARQDTAVRASSRLLRSTPRAPYTEVMSPAVPRIRLRDPDTTARRFAELRAALGLPPEPVNSGHFMTYQMDDRIRAHHAAPVVFYLSEGLRDDLLVAAIREHATSSTPSGFEVKITHPLSSTSTQIVSYLSDSSIHCILLDWDAQEPYIQVSLDLAAEVEFSTRPIHPEDSGVLDEQDTKDVTRRERAWEQLLKLRSSRKFNRMRNGLVTQFLDACAPMLREDLNHELDIAIVKALPRFRGRTWYTKTESFVSVELTTFAHAVMRHRLIDLARRAPDVQLLPLVLDAGDGPSNESSHEPDLAVLIDLRDALKNTEDADLLLYQAAGLEDSEVAPGVNLRMRRSRAKRRLAAQLLATEAA